ncbi:MAG: hypothetical protein R3E63_05130 [Pseudomonadales bacterium]
MKKTLINKTTLLAAVTMAGFVAAPFVNAASNPFSNTELVSGYNFDHPAEHQSGGDKKDEKSCTDKKDEKQCDNKDGKKDDVIPGHSEKAAAEGKCGEGKCGEGMMD